MKTLLLALSLCGLCHADTFADVTYLGSDNDGFTLHYDLDVFQPTTRVTGQNSYGDFTSIIVNGQIFPASELGMNPGQFEAGVFFVAGFGGTLLRYAFSSTDNGGTILNNYDGNIFPTIQGLAPGQTITAVRNGNTLTATNVSATPEPVSAVLVAAGLALVAFGASKRRK